MTKRFLVAALVTGMAGWPCIQSQARTANTSGYAGIEFYGSSQVSRTELEKELALRPGANLEATIKASRRLKEKLENRHLDANIDVAAEGPQYFVAVDIIEPGGSIAPAHKLVSPHRVYLSNDLPLSVYDQIVARLAQLADEGRPATNKLTDDGLKTFSDEPCNQFANKLIKLVPPMRSQLLEMVASDPDATRRSKAIEILNWDNRSVSDCFSLLPALEDTSLVVRTSADRYILPRVTLLPDNFPIQDLVEALSHQLCRPSHTDRTMALAGLLEIARRQPLSIGAIKVANEDKLKQLQAQSLLSSVKQPAQQLLDTFNHLPAPLPEAPKQRPHANINEF